jgi:hypothetical protein
MMPLKVAIAVLTGRERHQWINPDLTVSIFKAARDPRFETHLMLVRDARPFEVARNVALASGRDASMDWVLMIDNDNFPPFDLLDPIAEAEKDGAKWVVSVPSAVLLSGKSRMIAGCQMIAIKRRAWEKLGKGPWFRWVPSDNETLDQGPGGMSEDAYFIHKCLDAGIKVWQYSKFAGHYRTVDIEPAGAELARVEGGF